jgi:hypothetical protein
VETTRTHTGHISCPVQKLWTTNGLNIKPSTLLRNLSKLPLKVSRKRKQLVHGLCSLQTSSARRENRKKFSWKGKQSVYIKEIKR